MARNSKPTTKQAMDWFFQQDIWEQRRIAREASLKMYDELGRDMPQFGDQFRKAKSLQRQAIRACVTRDQKTWDDCEAQHRVIMDSIKAAR
jgi:hypothetical protein